MSGRPQFTVQLTSKHIHITSLVTTWKTVKGPTQKCSFFFFLQLLRKTRIAPINIYPATKLHVGHHKKTVRYN